MIKKGRGALLRPLCHALASHTLAVCDICLTVDAKQQIGMSGWQKQKKKKNNNSKAKVSFSRRDSGSRLVPVMKSSVDRADSRLQIFA